ncbi:MAG TPA: NAD(P)/FAD-dependent oxidoreductase [Anaerolineae bacterium]|nr:NAD(P)/FAD-dependent oxidoreductase [Anaerolineae bacterium]
MKSIIIIGAGIAGLSAGIYAAKNGYDVTLYESHFVPGGMCTGWQRRGFTFEGCLHYVQLIGAAPSHTYYDLWQELGVFPKTKMIQHDIFHSFQDQSGRILNLYTDVERLEKELLSLSPSDAQEIKALCTAIKRYAWFLRTTGKNPFRLLRKAIGILRGIPLMKKYGDMNMAEYATRFKDPLIRHALTYLFTYPDFACTNVFFFLAGMYIQGTGYPQGGSLALARTLEQTLLDLNGKIIYKKKVKRIEVQDGQTTGIELEDGTGVRADIVISAADGHATLFEMLEDHFTPPTIREAYATRTLFPPFIQVSLGVNRDMSGTPHALKVLLATPFELAGRTQQELWYQHFAYDPTLAPPGKTVITVLYPSDLAWWEALGYASEAYKTEKKRILETTIAQLEQVLPGISAQIEVSDVATPFTTLRYVHSWKASLGFMMTKEVGGEMVMKPQYTLPGLENFYMIGLWVKGFGVPMAAASGKEVIQKLCAADGKKFRTE